MAAKGKQGPPVDYEAYFPVKVPTDIIYMHNVLLTFVNAIPADCYVHCTSDKHATAEALENENTRQTFLRNYVEERLGKLAEYEYRAWVNGHTPFVTPRACRSGGCASSCSTSGTGICRTMKIWP